MTKKFLVLVVGLAVLANCGGVRESRLNPMNWFGSSREVKVAKEGEVNPLIPSSRGGLFGRRDRGEVDLSEPVDQVTDLRVERVPGGAIIRATGIDPRQGAFDVALTPANEDEAPVDGVLIYQLTRQMPAGASTGPEQTRRISAARRLTDQQLLGVRVIRVDGARNGRAVRR